MKPKRREIRDERQKQETVDGKQDGKRETRDERLETGRQEMRDRKQEMGNKMGSKRQEMKGDNKREREMIVTGCFHLLRSSIFPATH